MNGKRTVDVFSAGCVLCDEVIDVVRRPRLFSNSGNEYLGLIESLGKANLPPKEGQEIVSTFDTLDASCPH